MALVFPMFMMSVVIIRSVILFKRGAIRDKEVSLRLHVVRALIMGHGTAEATMSGTVAFRRLSTQ